VPIAGYEWLCWGVRIPIARGSRHVEITIPDFLNRSTDILIGLRIYRTGVS